MAPSVLNIERNFLNQHSIQHVHKLVYGLKVHTKSTDKHMQHQHHRAEQGNESTTRPGSRHKNTCGFCSESALSMVSNLPSTFSALVSFLKD